MRLCAIGDSFVLGAGDAAGLGWVGRLAAQARRRGADLTLYNLGVRGDSSVEIGARWHNEVAARTPPDETVRLVFSFGVNDCITDARSGGPRVARAASVENAAAILGRAKALAPTLMIGPPPIAEPDVNARLGPLDVALAECCRGIGVPYLGVFEPLLASKRWMAGAAAGDGAHPAAAGYRRLSGLVGAWPEWRASLG
jgi:acyl-CoA thioesterase I